MSVVAEVLQREINERLEQMEYVHRGIKRCLIEAETYSNFGEQTLGEIKELQDALEVEFDHLERVAAD